MRLAAGLRPNSLGELQRSPRPAGRYKGEGGKETVVNREGLREGNDAKG